MGIASHLRYRASVLAGAGLLVMMCGLALAQPAPAPAETDNPGFFGSVGRWFDRQVSGAKDTIMYAIIGLVIVALAQVIVRFVLTKATA